MNKKKKLIGSISALILAIALMGFGVYAATSVTGKVLSSVSFVSKDVKCTFKVDVDGGKYVSGGVGVDENEYRHKSQSIDNESVNTTHALDEFTMGKYTFDPTTEDGKKITYTITIINDGSNNIDVNYEEKNIFQNIPGIMSVTKTNMQSELDLGLNSFYSGKIELELLDSSADINISNLDIEYTVLKAGQVPVTSLSSFQFGSPSNKTIAITKFIGNETSVNIPSTDSNGNAITSISGFSGNKIIKKVIIPDSVTTLGSSVFSSCLALENVVTGDGITTIPYYTFNNCPALKSVTLGKEIISLGDSLFKNCSKLESVNTSASIKLTTLGKECFSGCSSLKNFTIPPNLTVLGDSAFYNCSSITNIVLPDTLKRLEYSTFRNCTSLTKITLSKTLEYLGQDAINNTAITSLFIPNSVKGIGSGSLGNSDMLTDVVVDSNNLKFCSEQSIVYNKDKTTLVICPSGVEEFYMPSTVTSIEYRAIDYCNSLKKVEVDPLNTKYSNDNQGVLYNKEKTSIICVPRKITNFIVPDVITTLNLYDYKYLTDLTIGSGITSLQLSNCTALKFINVNISNSKYSSDSNGVLYNKAKTTMLLYPLGKTEDTYTLQNYYVDTNAFDGNSTIKNLIINSNSAGNLDKIINLEQVTFQEGITNIGGLFNCKNITSVNLPSSATKIGGSAFSGCSKLANIIIPNNVTIIDYNAFMSCTSLKFVTIGEKVTSIGNSAFNGCTELTSINIPNSVTSIGSSCFEECRSLANITLSNKLKNIGFRAFYNCRALGSIIIPNTVTTIGTLLFAGCISLSDVTIGTGLSKLEGGMFSSCAITSIVIPNNITSIESNVFSSCRSLTNVTIGANITNIGESAFSDCVALSEINIPNKVTNIKDYAFIRCTSLKKITTGTALTSIGYNAFYDCSALESVSISSNITDGCFSYIPSIKNVTIKEGVTKITSFAFSGSSITTIQFPTSLISIENYALSNCKFLTNIFIPKNVNQINNLYISIFDGCSNLKKIEVDPLNANFSSDAQGALYNKNKTKLIYCPEALDKLDLLYSVTAIDEKAFISNSNLAQVTVLGKTTETAQPATVNINQNLFLNRIKFIISKTNSLNYYNFNAMKAFGYISDIVFNGSSTEFKSINNNWENSSINNKHILLNKKIECTDKSLFWDGAQWQDFVEASFVTVDLNYEYTGRNYSEWDINLDYVEVGNEKLNSLSDGFTTQNESLGLDKIYNSSNQLKLNFTVTNTGGLEPWMDVYIYVNGELIFNEYNADYSGSIYIENIVVNNGDKIEIKVITWDND